MRMPARWALSIVAALALAAIAGAGPTTSWRTTTTSAQTRPTVRVELERPTVGVGEEFSAFVYIENARSLGGFQFSMSFDESYLRYERSELTDFLGSTGRDVIVLGPVVDPGMLSLGAASADDPSVPGPDGDGDLAVITFTAVAEGQTELDLTQVLLVDTNNQRTEVDGESGIVVIGGAPIPSATSSSPATTAPPPTPGGTATPTSTASTPATPVPGGYDVFLPVSYRHE